ncbi:hypothetical protein E0F88_30195 [Dyadobacter psychrotolerans]|uniref:Methylamine utilisation protein MauE domain-containing protein n=2 Tax=Dyadobacter psychrotolerans TaxID=2541721 RepID=A0A4R5DCL5_9BACT|nr:hypothetical protein E0F88_30195 [Dyadobacter psychrotolerans]
MKRENMLRIIVALLVILYFYTALSKLMEFQIFKRQLSNQTIPKWSVALLAWSIPVSELLAVAVLITPRFRKTGFYLSVILMFVFTAYMGLVLINFFDRIPCHCGGVVGNMQFKQHFFFNLFFLIISIAGVFLCGKQTDRSSPTI